MSYGLITVKGLPKGRNNPTMMLAEIQSEIGKLYDFARNHPDYKFLVAYGGKEPDKRSLNGYTPRQLAVKFSAFKIPPNIVFEEAFYWLFPRKIKERP